MSLRKQVESRQLGYGGQAVIEGIMIRGPQHATVVCRRPDQSIAQRSRSLTKTYTGWASRVPLVRGVITLAETLHLGVWALMFSQNVALAEEEGDEDAGIGLIGGITLLLSFTIAIGAFFLAPIFATRWLQDELNPEILAVILEGLLRLMMLLGYLWLIGKMPDIRRVFQYHGAEHKTIAAWEAGEELTVDKIRPFSRAHPRCGTSFLLVVAVVAIIAFTALGNPPLWWHITSRLVLVPVIAGIAYETIRLGGKYRHRRVVGWLFAPNLWLQALTTREPADDQIEVAIAAMEQAIAQEQGGQRPAAMEAAPASGG